MYQMLQSAGGLGAGAPASQARARRLQAARPRSGRGTLQQRQQRALGASKAESTLAPTATVAPHALQAAHHPSSTAREIHIDGSSDDEDALPRAQHRSGARGCAAAAAACAACAPTRPHAPTLPRCMHPTRDAG